MKIKISLSLALMAAFVVLLVFVAGCTSAYRQPAQPPPAATAPSTGDVKMVEIASTGFNPSSLTVNAGDTVVFVNRDAALHRPASAQHPTHLLYPGSGADKCGTAGAANGNFDSCKGLVEGESWSFIFNQKGEWKYHDHLNCCSDPAFFGTIVVE